MANNQPSGWDGTRLLTAGVGDFNGDGKPDVAAYYRFDGNQIALFVFKGNGDGTFGNPVGSYQSGWDGLRMTPAGIGDFNGDGKLDVATFYHYPGNQTELFVFLGNGDGTFASSLIWGNYQTGWDGNSVIPAGVGDFNGDGKADVATFYRESSNVIAAFVFDGNGDGTFANPVAGYYDSGWDGTRSTPDGVADLNGDGKPDLLSFYRFDGNQEELFSFLNQGGNTFADPPTWGNTQSGWDGLRVIT